MHAQMGSQQMLLMVQKIYRIYTVTAVEISDAFAHPTQAPEAEADDDR